MCGRTAHEIIRGMGYHPGLRVGLRRYVDFPTAMRLYCRAGDHYWTREGRGRPPLNCPEHGQPPTLSVAPAKKAKREPPPAREERLWCEVGRHHWVRVGMGKSPKSCPEHKQAGLSPSAIAAAIEAVLADANNRGFSCRCGITPAMTRQDIRALGGGCTDPSHACPVLTAVRNKIGPDNP